MQRADFLSANLYSHVKMKLNSVKTCKNETKVFKLWRNMYNIHVYKSVLHIFVRHFWSNQRRCSIKKGVLKHSTKFTWKHLCQSLFFNKVAGWSLKTKIAPSCLSLNPFEPNVPFLYLLKMSENLWFLIFSEGIEMEQWAQMGKKKN